MKYFYNTSWLFVEKVFRIVMGLLVSIWLTRYLGPEKFGLFSYVQSFVSFFVVAAGLGLDGVIVRELVKNESQRDILLGTAFWLKLIANIICLAVLSLIVMFTSSNVEDNTLVLIIASASIFQSFNVIDFYFQSKVMSKYIVYANIIGLFLSSIVKIILILTHSSLTAFAYAIVFDNLILASGFIYYYSVHEHLSIRTWVFDSQYARNLLKNSLFFGFTALIIALYMKIDQIMLKEMLGNEAVGQYVAATRLSELWYFLPVIIARSLYPAIETAKKNDRELYFSYLQKLFDWGALLAYIIILPTIMLPHWIISVLYGTQYYQASSVLVIHICTLLFVFQRIMSEYWVLSENLVYFEVIKTLSGLVVNIILNIFLIEKYGIEGAAFSALISIMVSGYLIYAVHHKGFKIFKMMTNSLFLLNFLKRIKNARNF